jgi:hypothetical protein
MATLLYNIKPKQNDFKNQLYSTLRRPPSINHRGPMASMEVWHTNNMQIIP